MVWFLLNWYNVLVNLNDARTAQGIDRSKDSVCKVEGGGINVQRQFVTKL